MNDAVLDEARAAPSIRSNVWIACGEEVTAGWSSAGLALLCLHGPSFSVVTSSSGRSHSGPFSVLGAENLRASLYQVGDVHASVN